jgi:hypothetical protein
MQMEEMGTLITRCSSLQGAHKIRFLSNREMPRKVKLSMHLIKYYAMKRAGIERSALRLSYGLDGGAVGVSVPIGASLLSTASTPVLGPT